MTETASSIFTFRFPSEADAEVAPHGLDSVADSAEGFERFEADVEGDLVRVTVDCDEELEPGVAAVLDNWASSSGGYPV